MEPTKEANIAEQAAKALGISQLAPALYQDLLQPAARETGQNLLAVAKAVSLALAPLKGIVWGYERIRDDLFARVAAKLSCKPAGEIRSPDPVVAGPVMMGIAFAAEAPHLREMYANLLAAAMNAPSAEKAHPAFVQIIQQLSPGEARILQEIAKIKFSIEIHQTIDLCNYGESPGRFVQGAWRDFCTKCGIEEVTLADAYFDNLVRLGILTERTQVVSNPFAGVTGLSASGSLRVSDYGNMFLDICVRAD